MITFTEKAAAELVDPGARRARAAGRRRSTARSATRLLDAARDLYRAHIETIHSFATALLRERPVEAGIDPLFEVLEGLAAGLDFDARLRALPGRAARRAATRARAGAAPRVRARRSCAKRASTCTSTATCCRSRTPARPDDVSTDARELREIAARAAGMLDAHAQPRARQGGRRGRADRRVGRRARRARGRTSRSGCCVSGSRGEDEQRQSARTRTGAGRSSASRSCRTATTKRSTAPELSLRTDALLGAAAHIEQFVREYAQDRKRRGQGRLRRPAVLGARPAARQQSRRAGTSAGGSARC